MDNNRKSFTSHKGNQYAVTKCGKLFTVAKRGGRGRGKVGDWYEVRGTKRGRGYLDARIDGKIVPIHRIVARMFIGDYDDKLCVDHINGDPSDNRVENLRMATHKRNLQSYNKPTNGASSKYRGVWWHKTNKKWIAEIHPNGSKKHLGSFTSETDAALEFNKEATAIGWPKEALNAV